MSIFILTTIKINYVTDGLFPADHIAFSAGRFFLYFINDSFMINMPIVASSNLAISSMSSEGRCFNGSRGFFVAVLRPDFLVSFFIKNQKPHQGFFYCFDKCKLMKPIICV